MTMRQLNSDLFRPKSRFSNYTGWPKE